MEHAIRCVRTLSIVLVALSAPACVERPPRGPEDVDRTLTLSSYFEEGDLVAVVVGTRVARLRHDRPYIPLEIAIVNKGLRGLTLTRESFTLLDANGVRFPAVGRNELLKSYGSVDVDRRLTEIGPAVASKFATYSAVQSTLTGTSQDSLTRPLRLPRYAYAIDMLYFPRATEASPSNRFELFVDAPELDDPVFVRFEIR